MKAAFVKFNEGRASVISIDNNKTIYTLGGEKVYEGTVDQFYGPYVQFLSSLEVGQEGEYFNETARLKERIVRIL